MDDSVEHLVVQIAFKESIEYNDHLCAKMMMEQRAREYSLLDELLKTLLVKSLCSWRQQLKQNSGDTNRGGGRKVYVLSDET